jgi:hypothetical protein
MFPEDVGSVGQGMYPGMYAAAGGAEDDQQNIASAAAAGDESQMDALTEESPADAFEKMEN